MFKLLLFKLSKEIVRIIGSGFRWGEREKESDWVDSCLILVFIGKEVSIYRVFYLLMEGRRVCWE